MDNQTILTIVLAVLVVVLSVLLLRRIRTEKRQLETIKRMNLDEFSEFLRTNSAEGNIADVARKVSDLLQHTFGCDLILFLRKKRQNLELNYYHGLRDFDRAQFRTPARRELLAALATDFRPASIERLRGHFPDEYLERLRGHGFGLYFPVFWRENLYGLYFVRSTLETRSPSFHVLVASLAQSLAAAYHIKWHESRYDMVRGQLEQARLSVSKSSLPSGRYPSHLLRLINHRNSQTLLPKLVESIRKDLGFERVLYVYQPNGGGEPQFLQEGLRKALQMPEKREMDGLIRAIRGDDVYTLARLGQEQPGLRGWVKRLRDAGLDHVTLFPAGQGRPGLLVFGGRAAAREQIDALRVHVRDLIANVETYERIEELSQTDALTGLANQRYFKRRLDEEIQRAKRYNRRLALIFFDLDGLKQTNDTHGHLAGDSLIRQMGRILRKNIRSIDIIARYGGDEFCIIMPEADREMCARFMERVKNEVAKAQFLVAGIATPLTSTASLGGALYPDHADNPRQLIFAADMALLKAKEQGRNKSVLYDETAATPS